MKDLKYILYFKVLLGLFFMQNKKWILDGNHA